jgi:hypothetical protein
VREERREAASGPRSPSPEPAPGPAASAAIGGPVRTPGALFALQRLAGNGAVGGLVRTVQRRVPDGLATTPGTQRLAGQLDDSDEDGAIATFGTLDEAETGAILPNDRWRDMATSAFGNATMHRAMMATGTRGLLYHKLAWEFDEGTNWDQLRALITAAPPEQRRQVITQPWFRGEFTSELGNETMGEAVRLLGPPLTAQLDWMIDEGVDERQFDRLLQETAPADMLEAARDTALMGRLRGEVGADSRVLSALETAGRVASTATTPQGPRWTADDARLVATQMARPGVLEPRMAARIPGAVAGLPEADYTTLRTVLAIAGSDTERAFILKALAAGHGMTEIAEFALIIRDMSDPWLIQQLNVVQVTSTADTTGGSGIIQQFGNSCGPTSVQVVNAEADPIYALSLNSAGGVTTSAPTEATNPGTAPNQVMAGEQRNILLSNMPLGGNAPTDRTNPAGGAWVERDMSARKAATGVEYTRRDVPGDLAVDDALAIIATNVSAGIHVPIVVGQTPGDTAHYVVVISKDATRFQIHDVATGDVVWRTAEQFRRSQLALPSGHKALSCIAEPRVVQ